MTISVSSEAQKKHGLKSDKVNQPYIKRGKRKMRKSEQKLRMIYSVTKKVTDRQSELQSRIATKNLQIKENIPVVKPPAGSNIAASP